MAGVRGGGDTIILNVVENSPSNFVTVRCTWLPFIAGSGGLFSFHYITGVSQKAKCLPHGGSHGDSGEATQLRCSWTPKTGSSGLEGDIGSSLMFTWLEVLAVSRSLAP